MNQLNSTLIIFIKNPVLSKVKTRLAATMGDEKALQVYLALLEHTRNIALSLHLTRRLYYSNFIDLKDSWNPRYFEKYLQQGGDLGTKMNSAFHHSLQFHDKAIIIGSDCATLTPEIVSEAFVQLSHHDFVIGPATDGGYYLLGMKKHTPALFHEMSWSTERVLSDTLERINELNGSYFLLPELSDIDYEEDWLKHGWEL